MSTRRSAATRCLGDLEVFAREYWGRQPMVRRGSEPFDDLLDVHAVEEMLTNLGRRPTFRIVKAGTSFAPGAYTKRTRVGGVEIDDVADMEKVLDLVAAGSTVVLQGLHRTWTPLQDFCRELEEVSSHAVQANAYLSPPKATGLAAHTDRHDVIVLQVAGVKRWTVDGLGDVALTAGDAMYLPAGARHAASTAESFSLHLTIGLMVTTRRQVLRRIIDGLDADLDRPLAFGYANGDPEALAADLDEVLRRVAGELAQTSVAAAAEEQLTRSRRLRRTRSGRLAAAVEPTLLTDDQRLRRRAETTLCTEIDADGGVVVQLADRRLRMPAAASAAMAVVGAKTELTVGELVGLDRSSRVVLAGRLIREGLLEIADQSSR